MWLAAQSRSIPDAPSPALRTGDLGPTKRPPSSRRGPRAQLPIRTATVPPFSRYGAPTLAGLAGRYARLPHPGTRTPGFWQVTQWHPTGAVLGRRISLTPESPPKRVVRAELRRLPEHLDTRPRDRSLPPLDPYLTRNHPAPDPSLGRGGWESWGWHPLTDRCERGIKFTERGTAVE